jgi:hypothetical protein
MSDREAKHPREPEQPPGVRAGKVAMQRDPVKAALFEDALASARSLKRNHHAYYASDRKGFRAIVKKAHARVFRLKPGPKADARMAKAARERADGGKWPELYPRHIEHYATMPEFTRELAEAGFRRKVDAHLRRHPYLRRRSAKKTVTTKSRRSS